ncbi:hypothetical protein A2U01_0101119 [Trifolium medium]|uniref:Uncharacterized protein n=1 Tax=Trifolium medium TaxID=97028 RepID=A0A392UV00_9FABA|nr:hypothetical protein [Trifolium medium]
MSLEHCSIVISWGGLAFCHLRGAQLALALRTVPCARAGAARIIALFLSDFLLVIARRAQVVCATRRVFGQG